MKEASWLALASTIKQIIIDKQLNLYSLKYYISFSNDYSYQRCPLEEFADFPTLMKIYLSTKWAHGNKVPSHWKIPYVKILEITYDGIEIDPEYTDFKLEADHILLHQTGNYRYFEKFMKMYIKPKHSIAFDKFKYSK